MSPAMRPDTELRRSLHEAAERVAVPSVDVDALRAAGRRDSRRRTAFTALAAAAVLAAVVGGGVALTTQDSRRGAPDPVQRTERPEPPRETDPPPTPDPPAQPTSVADLPRGGWPVVPYLNGDSLYTHRVVTDLEAPENQGMRSLATGGGVTLGVRRSGELVRVDMSGHLRPLGVEGSDVAVSGDGRWASWLVPGEPAASAALWDLRSGELVAVRELPVRGQCCDGPIQMVGVDASARVFVTGVNGTFVWESGTDEVHRVDGQPYGIVQVLRTAAVRMEAPTSKEELPSYTFGRVDENGELRPIQVVRGHSVQWSPDGGSVARQLQPGAEPMTDSGERLEVLDPATGEWRPMLIPEDTSLGGYIWENREHLLVTVSDADQSYFLLRCDVEDGGCELAGELGREGDQWVLPER